MFNDVHSVVTQLCTRYPSYVYGQLKFSKWSTFAPYEMYVQMSRNIIISYLIYTNPLSYDWPQLKERLIKLLPLSIIISLIFIRSVLLSMKATLRPWLIYICIKQLFHIPKDQNNVVPENK